MVSDDFFFKTLGETCLFEMFCNSESPYKVRVGDLIKIGVKYDRVGPLFST